LSVAAGGACAQALSAWVSGERVTLKWPNDVYLRGRKLCGVLVELSPGPAPRLVIGVGVNLNNGFSGAPPDVAARGIAVSDVVGRATPPGPVLRSLIDQLQIDLPRAARRDETLAARWRGMCELTGKLVSIADADRRTVGMCQGIENDGSLWLQTEAGPQNCRSGVVEVLSTQ
jgi:BirA family biotin operon repressor/biotin-[acetyl-CoA-carboxylase] ligase